ncbi:MAG: YcfL family protein [Opitutaceae bacterium]|nr:YcfL family protein [Opitutaceae bacterium]
MNNKLAVIFAGLLPLVFLAGCASEPGPYAPLDTTKYTLENTERFVLLDKPAQYSVTCTGLQERPLADGRLEVVANVKNREARRIQVQVNCVFKDEQGFSTGDETPWQTLILSEYATEAVRFTAMNPLGKKYTVRVRQAR